MPASCPLNLLPLPRPKLALPARLLLDLALHQRAVGMIVDPINTAFWQIECEASRWELTLGC